MISYWSIFNPFKGNIFQVLLKLWIFPWFPRLTIFVCTCLGVGVFRHILMNTIGRTGRGSRYQSNYHIGERTMNNLLTFATNQTMFNEVVHDFALFMNIPIMVTWVSTGLVLSPINILLLFLLAVNLYCVLLQRYNRAKLALLIERRLSRGELPDHDYRNWLGLNFGNWS